ncbi:MAG: MlaD family protein [Dialister sp.]
MRVTKEARVGIITVVILAAAALFYFSLSFLPFSHAHTMHINAVFSSVQGIKKGNEVRYAGVHIGNVEKITVEKGKGILRLGLDKKVNIPEDAEFSISQDSLVGDYYVRIRGGAQDGNYFTDGMTAEETKSGRMEKLEEKAETLVKTVNETKENFQKMKGTPKK